jgi:enamine deaminase RidA (YjgF/YER057c/UK114 family)
MIMESTMSLQSPLHDNPKTLPTPPGYSQLVEVGPGRLIFVAGQVGLNVSGELVGNGDFRQQAEQAFRNLIAAIESRGGAVGSIIKLSMFLTDMKNLPVLREVRDGFIAPGPGVPASTTVEVSALFRPEFLFEVEALAWLPAVEVT